MRTIGHPKPWSVKSAVGLLKDIFLLDQDADVGSLARILSVVNDHDGNIVIYTQSATQRKENIAVKHTIQSEECDTTNGVPFDDGRMRLIDR